MAPEHHDDLGVEGNFDRTLWHEIGHYLGPDEDPRGRPLDEALQENSDLIEEMKADLVSLFSAGRRARAGDLEPERLRSIYASGIRRVLQTTRPRRSQPYQTMQLMQMNYFLESGLLEFEAEQRKLRIHYERYPEVVESLLREVLRVQASGDKAASDDFVARYSGWKEGLHGVLARAMQAAGTYRYRLVLYAALGE